MKELDQLKNLFESLKSFEEDSTNAADDIIQPYLDANGLDAIPMQFFSELRDWVDSNASDEEIINEFPMSRQELNSIKVWMKMTGFTETLVHVEEADDDENPYAGGDWGSSDWSAVIDYMDEYINKHGLNPDTVMDAAREAAISWGGMMGHDMRWKHGEDAAIQDCKDGWVRMSKRGQALTRMFAPVEEAISEVDTGESQSYEVREYREKLSRIRDAILDATIELDGLDFEHGHGGITDRAKSHAMMLGDIVATLSQDVIQLRKAINSYIDQSATY